MELIKKYSNRRLYNTVRSRYISLEELAATVRAGKEIRVVDAKSGADLTQLTLAQIIFESKNAARLLPPQLLTALIRLSDDALAEFLGQYVSAALDLYTHAKAGAQALSPYVPFGGSPFGGGSFGVPNPFARLWSTPAPPPPAPAPAAASSGDVADLRREVAELKASLRKRRK